MVFMCSPIDTWKGKNILCLIRCYRFPITHCYALSHIVMSMVVCAWGDDSAVGIFDLSVILSLCFQYFLIPCLCLY